MFLSPTAAQHHTHVSPCCLLRYDNFGKQLSHMYYLISLVLNTAFLTLSSV